MSVTNARVFTQVFGVVGAIIERDSKFLLVKEHHPGHSAHGKWNQPAGWIDVGENPIDAVIREVREETGLDIKMVMPFSVFDYQIEKPDEIRDSTQINFLVTSVNDKNVVLSEEHQAFVWITKEEIDKYDFTEATKKVIQKAFEIINKLVR